MLKELNETKGDVYAWANILLSYYKNALSAKNGDAKDMLFTAKLNDVDKLRHYIRHEVRDDAIETFALAIDDCYRNGLKQMIGYKEIRSSIVSDEQIMALYNTFKQQFPLLHNTFNTIISSKHFDDSKMDCEATTMHKKQRMIFFLCLASIRAKSSHKIRYYAIIEPLALFYKGHQQPSSKTLSGSFTTTIETALKIVDMLYNEVYPSFAAELESEPVQVGAGDNWQRVLPCKNQYTHKSAIVHNGTSYYLKKVVNIEIPAGSNVISSTGLKFKVLRSTPHAVDGDFWFVPGVVFDYTGVDVSVPIGLVEAEKTLDLLLPHY